MALETLKNIESIDGFQVLDIAQAMDHIKQRITSPEMQQREIKKLLSEYFIQIDHGNNLLIFKLQSAPISEVGVNGCQVDTIIMAAHDILMGLNIKYPCHENEMAINKLRIAIKWLEKRKTDREARGVEGTNGK